MRYITNIPYAAGRTSLGTKPTTWNKTTCGSGACSYYGNGGNTSLIGDSSTVFNVATQDLTTYAPTGYGAGGGGGTGG